MGRTGRIVFPKRKAGDHGRSKKASSSTRRGHLRDEEKACQPPLYASDSDHDDDDVYEDASLSDTSSQTTCRSTSGSQRSNRPLLGRGRTAKLLKKRPRSGARIMKYLCWLLIGSLLIFILMLIHLSLVSSYRVQLASVKSKHKAEEEAAAVAAETPGLQELDIETFPRLRRFYGGLSTLMPWNRDAPTEYPRDLSQESPVETWDEIEPWRTFPTSHEYTRYKDASPELPNKPRQECFLDREQTVKVPHLHYFEGLPKGFPKPITGSYDLMNMDTSICFDRYGRFGAYGYGYEYSQGGTGTGLNGDRAGANAVWERDGKFAQTNYTDVDWADVQNRCWEANQHRFAPSSDQDSPSATPNAGSKAKRDGAGGTNPLSALPQSYKRRTAVVLRGYDNFRWNDEVILNIRALITELSLSSGGEYDVHLLVQVKDEATHPIWADAKSYHEHLARVVPKEFRGITTLWSETQMLMLYQGLHDSYYLGMSVYGVYRGLMMAMQHFAQRHPDYDHYWELEFDMRSSGHYLEMFEKMDQWAMAQPRKGLWERNARFYIPEVHGTWDDFVHFVEDQIENGHLQPSEIADRRAAGESLEPIPSKPIWGPSRPGNAEDWFEIDKDIVPPHSYEDDNYDWGVGEDADLITLQPLFNTSTTTWLYRDDLLGYSSPYTDLPRRAVLVAGMRMSRRLLETMHRETAIAKHFGFPEIWAPSVALHHGYKAVSVQHPRFVDREWPYEYFDHTLNAGLNGEVGGLPSAVYGSVHEDNGRGMNWWYNSHFSAELWKRWFGVKLDGLGGEEFELQRDEGKSGAGLAGIRGGEGRMCLPSMLIHPIKEFLLPSEESRISVAEELTLEHFESNPDE